MIEKFSFFHIEDYEDGGIWYLCICVFVNLEIVFYLCNASMGVGCN